jgi:hypothetical protein
MSLLLGIVASFTCLVILAVINAGPLEPPPWVNSANERYRLRSKAPQERTSQNLSSTSFVNN